MESRARIMLNIQDLASKAGALRRKMASASPSQKVILQIQITMLENEMSLVSKPLQKKEWRVC